MSQKIYQMITDKIIKLMGEGLIPWEKPWKGGGPKNLATGRFYRGINILLLCTEGNGLLGNVQASHKIRWAGSQG